MSVYIGDERELGFAQRYLGGWRVIASAWAVAIVVLLLFAGMQILPSRHVTVPRPESLVGAVIPRHDPSCAGTGEMTASANPNCQFLGDALARSEAEAPYGY
jgi:hypothetical protein